MVTGTPAMLDQQVRQDHMIALEEYKLPVSINNFIYCKNEKIPMDHQGNQWPTRL